jgi:hypothetical protein
LKKTLTHAKQVLILNIKSIANAKERLHEITEVKNIYATVRMKLIYTEVCLIQYILGIPDFRKEKAGQFSPSLGSYHGERGVGGRMLTHFAGNKR